ncbi:MAG: 50S ribosomal protein L4 [Nanoarchaeota archaeon]
MKLPIMDSAKKNIGEVTLPSQFAEEFRPDLIRRAVQALQANARQPYGNAPLAGMRSSSKLTKRRRKYRGCYGLGISRVNRKILSRRGTRFNWVGAFSPHTVGGLRAHPPKAEKKRSEKINKKENRKAIRSAMAATLNRSVVEERGHKIPAEYPFILNSTAENLQKTKDVEKMLIQLGFAEELQRSQVKVVRAGRGKLRGRKYKRKKGLLIITGSNCPLTKSARNIPGIDVAEVKSLNAELLAPGAVAGRATLWTEQAVRDLAGKKLFV